MILDKGTGSTSIQVNSIHNSMTYKKVSKFVKISPSLVSLAVYLKTMLTLTYTSALAVRMCIYLSNHYSSLCIMT